MHNSIYHFRFYRSFKNYYDYHDSKMLRILRYKLKFNVSNSRYFRINSYLCSGVIWSFSTKKLIISMLILLQVCHDHGVMHQDLARGYQFELLLISFIVGMKFSLLALYIGLTCLNLL